VLDGLWARDPATRQALAFQRAGMRHRAVATVAPAFARAMVDLFRHSRYTVTASVYTSRLRASLARRTVRELGARGATLESELTMFIGWLARLQGRAIEHAEPALASVDAYENGKRVRGFSTLGAGNFRIVVRHGSHVLECVPESGFWGSYAQVAFEGITGIDVLGSERVILRPGGPVQGEGAGVADLEAAFE
jgi:hypothetical protein